MVCRTAIVKNIGDLLLDILVRFHQVGGKQGGVIARRLRYSAIVRVKCSVPFILLNILEFQLFD